MSNDHDTQTDAPALPFPDDADHDGIPPVYVDPDGPAGPKPGQWRDVRVIVDPRTGRKRKVADLGWADPDDAPVPLDEAIAEREGMFERIGKRADAAVRLWQALAALGFVGFLACGYYLLSIWHLIGGASLPAAPASQGAVYRLLREARDQRSDLWLVIVADEADGAKVEAAMAKDEGGER